MQTLLQPCKSFPFLNSLTQYFSLNGAPKCKCSVKTTPSSYSFTTTGTPGALSFSKITFLRSTRIVFCSQNDTFDEFSSTQLPESLENDSRIRENEELELLNKPSPVPVNNGFAADVEKPDKDEALEPFLKFFRPGESLEVEEGGGELGVSEEKSNEFKKVGVEYYEPKPGDLVVGVVVSGNENKLDVNVGADMLGTMLTKEVLPLYDKEMEYLSCDLKTNVEEFMGYGKMGIVKDDDAMSGGPVPGRPVVETGTMLFAEVLGRTLSGRPLLSTRRLFRRIAWHRVRQIKQLDEPIEVKFTEWNTGGLLTRIEGLRAFLPKAELMKRVNNFSELKEYTFFGSFMLQVGCRMYVKITRINEANNDLILSEREAWEMLHLRDGTLLEGIVVKILPYGAQVRIGDSNRSGLLHISNMSKTRITSVAELLKEGEKIKVLVVKSLFPDKISLSTADLESEPGLFISNKERVFSEAEEMAKKYRQNLPAVSAPRNVEPLPTDALPFDNEESLYVNWKWFKFEREDESS
ncbi:PREDICTED: 30S ribosomal protein S1 homolog A isoform X1 [Theobroma cacao]|uniref:30S ribosomal protein S1 homolog A isoform X1 n=1 Tax=Theobroma cacao TaxID=3641 RepID=A0AB32UWJ1_THECC|nr:PREDICTED: 30S ribosomal protein S1 homolog A isoform X1 [Theobroma cacao]